MDTVRLAIFSNQTAEMLSTLFAMCYTSANSNQIQTFEIIDLW